MTWKIDPAHSSIQFSVRHMMISTVRGRFRGFSGEIEFDPDRPEQTTVFARIDASSIDTDVTDRDNHLRSPDFLEVEAYPYLIFESKRVEQTGEETAQLIGDLTVRDTTREVVLDVAYQGMAQSPWGTTSAGFAATTTLNRKNWGLAWNQALETGGVLVGDKIKVNIEVELIKEEETETAQVAA
jgi:polyisoprenoid-binding protein YceI